VKRIKLKRNNQKLEDDEIRTFASRSTRFYKSLSEVMIEAFEDEIIIHGKYNKPSNIQTTSPQ